jgi:hypothetical protein
MAASKGNVRTLLLLVFGLPSSAVSQPFPILENQDSNPKGLCLLESRLSDDEPVRLAATVFVSISPLWILSIQGTAGWEYAFAYKDKPNEPTKPLFVYLASTNGLVEYIDHSSPTGVRYYEA